jgi:hypothetical protein
MELPQSISEAPATRTPSLADKLATIRQMLATLDTLTIAGRNHLMAKVLAFVDGQVQGVIHHAGHRNRGMLLEQLAVLRRESDRQLPSVVAFGERAESLLALLAIGA